ncbi:MAG TPA: response regulator [Chloroflexota bacterium]|nr:response regulator [Chloroflexota bacterium]
MQGRQRRILVVEDDPTTSDILRILLEDSGCSIVTAENGEEALRRAQEGDVDLITLDLGLPGIDGRELLRRFRDEPNTARVPVIVITGMWFDTDRSGDVAAVLEKPFDAEELEKAVRQVLELHPNRTSRPQAPPQS